MYNSLRIIQEATAPRNTELEPIDIGYIRNTYQYFLCLLTVSFCRSSQYHEPTYDPEKVWSQHADIRYRTLMADRFKEYSFRLYFSADLSDLIRKTIRYLFLGFVLIYISSLYYFITSYKSGCRCSRCRLYGNTNIV